MGTERHSTGAQEDLPCLCPAFELTCINERRGEAEPHQSLLLIVDSLCSTPIIDVFCHLLELKSMKKKYSLQQGLQPQIFNSFHSTDRVALAEDNMQMKTLANGSPRYELLQSNPAESMKPKIICMMNGIPQTTVVIGQGCRPTFLFELGPNHYLRKTHEIYDINI